MSNWTDIPGYPGMKIYSEAKTLEYFKQAERTAAERREAKRYQDAITGVDQKATQKLIRGLRRTMP